ncbi:MAG: hypothetical protein ACTHNT_09735 [Actinomycetales bacterium]
MHHEVGADAKDVAVVRGMVNLAKTQTVAHDGLSTRLSVSNDVRSVEELPMTQRAYCALPSICQHYSASEYWLMKALSAQALCVTAFYDRTGCNEASHHGELILINRYDVPAVLPLLYGQKDRHDRSEGRRNDFVQPNQWQPQLRSPAQLRVVSPIRVARGEVVT